MVTSRLRHLQEIDTERPIQIELDTPGDPPDHEIRVAADGTYRIQGQVLLGGVPTETELVIEIRRNADSLAQSKLVLTGRGGGVCVDLPARLVEADQLSLWAKADVDGMIVPAQSGETDIKQTGLTVTPTDHHEATGS